MTLGIMIWVAEVILLETGCMILCVLLPSESNKIAKLGNWIHMIYYSSGISLVFPES